MANEKPGGGDQAEHGRLGILFFALGRVERLARRHTAGGAEEESIHKIGRFLGDIVERQPATIYEADVAQRYVLDVMAGNAADDGCIARVGAALAAREPLGAGNQAGAADRNVFQALAPDQAVMPVAMPEILKSGERVGLGGIVSRRVGARFDGAPRLRISAAKIAFQLIFSLSPVLAARYGLCAG